MSRRDIGMRLMLVGLGIALPLALAEAGLRLSGAKRQFAQANGTIGYVLTPDYTRRVPITDPPAHQVELRTNQLGLRRDTQTTVPKPPHLRRVVVLGDSQSEGIVDNRDTYCAQIERLLGATANVEVLDAAVSGYSPLLEWLWWRERGGALSADLVVLALYSGNDIAELLMRHEDFGGYGPTFSIPYLAAVPDGLRLELPGSGAGAWGRADHLLKSWSRLYALTRRVLRTPASSPSSPLAVAAAQCPGCFQSLWQEWLAFTQPNSLDDGFTRLEHVLDELQGDLRARGIALVIAVIPTKLQVEPQSVTAPVMATRALLGLPGRAEGIDQAVHNRIVAASRRRGLATVDLLPALRAASARDGATLYWQQDWHLNPSGHAAVAAALAPVIQASLARVDSPFP